MEFSYLPDATEHPAWPAIKALLQPAVMADEEVVADGDCVWIAFEGQTIFAAATTRLESETEARLRLAAGTRLNEWIGLLNATVSAWAANCGAEKLTMRGRRGWVRFAKRFGWAVLGQDHNQRTLFEKVL